MNFQFIIDNEKEMVCTSAEYTDYDDIIMMNLAKIESIPEYVSVETHEILHALFTDITETSEDQDHFIIRRLLWGCL